MAYSSENSPFTPDRFAYMHETPRSSNQRETIFPLTPTEDHTPKKPQSASINFSEMSAYPYMRGRGRDNRSGYKQESNENAQDCDIPYKARMNEFGMNLDSQRNSPAPGPNRHADMGSVNFYGPQQPHVAGNSAPMYPGHTQSLAPYIPPYAPSNATSRDEIFAPVDAAAPFFMNPPQSQLNVAYAYGIDRGDGTFTRLLRADELEPIQGIPRHQGPEGLIILPPVRIQSPTSQNVGRMSETNAALQPLGFPNQQGQFVSGSDARPEDHTQHRIDSIVSQASTPVPGAYAYGATRRREKIYCDKWVHEGVCAFTQIGCKFKHEMPMDKETQLQLGLNHGLPAWYRRANCIQLTSSQPSVSQPNSPARLASSWRRGADTPPPPASSGTGPFGSPMSQLQGARETAPSRTQSRSQSRTRQGSARNFGPICPPPRSSSNNRYAALPLQFQSNTNNSSTPTRHASGSGSAIFDDDKRMNDDDEREENEAAIWIASGSAGGSGKGGKARANGNGVLGRRHG